jgi:putative two-component system response regulator
MDECAAATCRMSTVRPTRQKSQPGSGRGTPESPGEQPLIMIAEDSTTQARWIESVLTAAGYRVVISVDGPAALKLVRRERPDIILADVDMPGLDGFEVCRRVKEDPGLRSIPFVMVTHRDRVTDLVRALEAGADNYLTKPLDETTVTARVQRILADVQAWRDRLSHRRARLGVPPEEMALSLERAQVVEMLMASAQKLELELGSVSEVGIALTMTHDLDGVLKLLCEQTMALSDAALVTVVLRRDDGSWWTAANLGGRVEMIEAVLRLDRADAKMPFVIDPLALRERIQIRWDDPDLPAGLHRWRYPGMSYGWPLVLEDGLLGILFITYSEHRSLSADDDRRYRFLANQAALAVVNARMFQQEVSYREALVDALAAEKEAHKNAMFMLAAAVEARDGLTGAHLRRVQAYAEALAARLGLAQEIVDEIGYSSILHDVGKLLVPDEVLGKPGKLSEAEWEEMRRHPEHGEQILGDREFFAMARDIAKCHHERWDGRGYPLGLRGEAIPIAARITSVADVFDALTTKRHYKDAWPDDEALAELRTLSGSSFDPMVVEAFLGLYAEGEVARLRARFSEQ